MTRDVARGLAAAGGMADVNGIAKIEMLDDRRGIGCVVIHIMAAAHLARATVPAAIMGDDAIALVDEKEHLGVPVVGAQRPAVVKDNRLGGLRPPVFVEDLQAVFGGDRGHGIVPLSRGCRKLCFFAPLAWALRFLAIQISGDRRVPMRQSDCRYRAPPLLRVSLLRPTTTRRGETKSPGSYGGEQSSVGMARSHAARQSLEL